MARATDLLALVDDEHRHGLTLGDPADDALVALLAHVAFADGKVDDRELRFLEKVLPGRDREELRKWAVDAGKMHLDLALVAEALPDLEERWAGLRFAARMAFKDGVIAPGEQRLLDALAHALALPEDALARVLVEVKGHATGPISAERLAEALGSFPWRSVQHGTGDLRSDLATVLPKGAAVVRRIGIENVEVLAFTDRGVVGRFLEGNAFVPWSEIVTYTRVPTLAAAVQLVTESGRRWTLVDHRLNGLGSLFDRLFGTDRPTRPSRPPKIEHTRGSDSDDGM